MRLAPYFTLVTLAAALTTCAQPECARPDFTRAECRVLAENELARIRLSAGVEVRFQPPAASNADLWDAMGVLHPAGPASVRGRVVGPGDFAVSLEAEAGGPGAVSVTLDNVDPRMRVVVDTPAGTSEVAPPPQGGTRWTFTVAVPDGQVSWIRGELECPESFRVLALGDIQTNPFQFERIVEKISLEHAAAPADEPVLGLMVLGDVTELSNDVEFELIAELFETVPIPVAATPGNHDVFASSRAVYNRTFGPGNYAVDVCGARLLMLDTGNGALARSVEGRLAPMLAGRGYEYLVVGTHYPAFPGLTGNGWAREEQAQHLLVEAAVASADLLLAGHVHALLDFPKIDVAGARLREIVVGTAGADQGLSVARYGYLRMTFGDELEVCFVEVPPPGTTDPQNSPLSATLPNCLD